MTLCSHPERLRFQSTCPARGTTSPDRRPLRSYHHFNPRAPRGARPRAGGHVPPATERISIHVPREGHDAAPPPAARPRSDISIHVPREGHDPWQPHPRRRGRGISIHVPREGHDGTTGRDVFHWWIFQSTCPARGTTLFNQMWVLQTRQFQSTCPARGTTSPRRCAH